MAGFLDPETVRAVCKGMPRYSTSLAAKTSSSKKGPKDSTSCSFSSSSTTTTDARGITATAYKLPAAAPATRVDERGLTPAMRQLLESEPPTPPPPPPPPPPVGSRIELCDLVGAEREWNGRRGTVTAKHLSMHPDNKNVRAWVLEIAFDKPIAKTTFFSDHCRPLGPRTEPSGQRARAKIKPNAKCPCGSKKKYKKCCGRGGAKNGLYVDPSGALSSASGAVPLAGEPRPKLRFKVGDKVQAFAGVGEWINGTIIRLWDQGNPYRIELEDGTNVWGPEDVSNFVRPRISSKQLRFRNGDKVLANALGGWKFGTVIRVWDHGNPYRIELDDGTNVWGPEDIDKFVRPIAPGKEMDAAEAARANEAAGDQKNSSLDPTFADVDESKMQAMTAQFALALGVDPSDSPPMATGDVPAPSASFDFVDADPVD